MSIWDTPISKCSTEELEKNFHWFNECEGGKGMKDLINYDRVCNELENRGYEIKFVSEANTYSLHKSTEDK